jgi:hypothetical protein
MIPRTRTPFDKLTVAELVNIFLIDLMFISIFTTYTDVEGASCPGNSRIQYFDTVV